VGTVRVCLFVWTVVWVRAGMEMAVDEVDGVGG